MGNKQAAPRRQSTINNSSAPLLVQQHQQRMNRRCSEYNRCRTTAELGVDRGLGTPTNDLAAVNAAINRRRWSSQATVQNRSTMKPKRLAPRQRNIIIKSWNKIAKAKIGKDIFVAIFNEAEELKTVFGIPLDLRGKRLRADPKFNSHTDLFIDTLDFVVQNLDNIGMVTENAEKLGIRHAALRIENFRPEYWNIFTECIVETVSSQLDKETQIAWRQLILMLIFYIRLGYDRETLRVSRHENVRRCNTTTGQIPEIPVLLYP